MVSLVRIIGLTAVWLAAGVHVQGAPVPDEEALRRAALAFNDVSGEHLIDQTIEDWKGNTDKLKALIGVAAAMAKEKDQPFNYTAGIILGELAREVRDVESGMLFYQISLDKAEKLKSDRKVAVATIGMVDLLFENKKYAEAEKLCTEFLDRRGSRDLNIGKVQALRRMIQVLALQGKEEEAFKKLQPFVKAAADDPIVLEIQGWLFRYVGKYEEALKNYEKLFKLVENEAAKDVVRYQLSGLYTELGDIDKASEQLLALLKKNPNNPTYNNDLGYIWADNDRNLDEAEKMIRKALERQPNNPAFLDSMGWVLFKQKKYEEAKKYLEKAILDPDGQHAEIYDHLGDVYLALKDKEKAVEFWKKALEVSGTSKRDLKRKEVIERKLKDLQ